MYNSGSVEVSSVKLRLGMGIVKLSNWTFNGHFTTRMSYGNWAHFRVQGWYHHTFSFNLPLRSQWRTISAICCIPSMFYVLTLLWHETLWWHNNILQLKRTVSSDSQIWDAWSAGLWYLLYEVFRLIQCVINITVFAWLHQVRKQVLTTSTRFLPYIFQNIMLNIFPSNAFPNLSALYINVSSILLITLPEATTINDFDDFMDCN
jgi:hypothetical protein